MIIKILLIVLYLRTSHAYAWVNARILEMLGADLLLAARQHGVPDHHTDPACPTVLSTGKIHRLLVDHLAGMAVGDFNQHVIVGHGGSAYYSDHGLVGAELRRDAGLAAIAVA